MKVRRGILSILISILAVIVIGAFAEVQAASDRYLGIERYRDRCNLSYAVLKTNVIAWKITEYSNTSRANANQSKTIYCIKAGPGFGSNDMSSSALTEDSAGHVGSVRNYNQSFDLKNRSSIPSPYDSALPSGANYNSLVWVIDHCYVAELDDSSKTNRTQFLNTVKTFIESEFPDDTFMSSYLTDDDIDAVQQAAIWYFTNSDSAIYHPTGSLEVPETLAVWTKTKSGAAYEPIEGDGISGTGYIRAEACDFLYYYFVKNGVTHSSQTPTSTGYVSNLITIAAASEVEIEESGNKYIIGPYRYTETNNGLEYSIVSSELKNGNTTVSHTILNSSKQTSNINNVKGQNFYIAINKDDLVSGLKFTVKTSATQKTINYLSVTAANASALAVDQPLVEIGETTIPDEDQITLPNIQREFDLALRKFISEVNDIAVTGADRRQINVDVSPLVNKTDTTAIYKHQKAPVKVAVGDTVTYTLRVFNEGELDGYVTEITDHLPEQLELVENDTTLNSQYTYTKVNDRTIKITIRNNRKLNAFANTMTTPDYIDVKIKCRVKSAAATTVITNIADITGFTDENGNAVTDRDSQVGALTLPTTDRGWQDYVGKTGNNNTDLANANRYWPGQQDDDDFDKLEVKTFDLALRKYITAVTDKDGNAKQIDSRVPQIGTWKYDKNTSTNEYQTLQKQHRKDALEVETGDTVVYTITVYNEGEVDGYASKITDYLPEGLELKQNSTINTIWSNPSGDGRTIVTTELADKLLNAYGGQTTSRSVQVECVVTAEFGLEDQTLKNIAEITEHKDKNGNSITDRDSQPGNVNRNPYSPTNPTDGRGEQDDDDFEDLFLPAKVFDLALRKFITDVNDVPLTDEGVYIKEPVIDTSKLNTIENGEEVTTATYKHQKAPVGVKVGDEVIYTIRVYNEGGLNGYVTEITDHLPSGLEFINDSFNAGYGWEANGKTVKTTITSPNTTYSASRDIIYTNRTDNDDKVLLKAFDGTTLDSIEVKIKCKVVSTNSLNNVITNIADITGMADAKKNALQQDRDSQINNVVLPTTEKEWSDYKANNKSVLTDRDWHYKGQQDDDDFDKLILEEFDLALRKFITGVNETAVTNRYPVFTTNLDENGNYIYEHTKEPILVETTDLVEYTIRIFNEGDIDGYAKEIKDDIPDGLEFVPDESLNQEYRWKMLDKDGNETEDSKKAKYIVTDYLSREQELAADRDNLLKAFDKVAMTEPDHKDVKAVFKVIAPNSHEGIITNTAEISDDSDENGNPITDRDSTPNNDNPKEDDIDVEHIKLAIFDLALRKFITGVNETAVTNRYPVFKITEDGQYVYEHTKEPVEVENGNIVTYTIRVYNEGTMNGFAKQVKDDLPEGILYLPDNETNKEYRWVMLDKDGNETKDVSKAVSIATDYLSKEQQDETGRDNLLKAFNSSTMQEPDHRDLKIAFKVTEPNTSDRIIINKAQISDDSDEKGNEVVDKDSTPDKWIEGEDDQDIEKIKVKYFDLALRKWVTQAIVIENGKQTVTNTGHKAEDDPEKVVKVEIAKGKLNKVVVKFKYSIRVTNEGQIAGYAKEISDYIPEGLKFVAADNPDWKEADGKIITTKLANTLLKPGQSAEVEVLLTWINGANNMGQKVNVAEISKDKNDSNTPDIDSVPNNKKPGEDDIDDAPVMLATKTGEFINTEYVLIGTLSFAILAGGVIFIKKYIL